MRHDALPHGKTAVITRTKNRPLLLRRAIESVLAQTDGDFVHVIVNDGGDHAELDALLVAYRERFAGRLRVVHNERSLGLEAASNVGLRSADSRYVVIHDDDDSWQPGFLEAMTGHVARHAHVRNFGGAVCYANEVHEAIDGARVLQLKSAPMTFADGDLTLWRMCVGNFFPPIAFLYTREALEATGPYREDLPVQGDWEFNLRFMQRYEIGVVRERLANYHIRVPERSAEGSYANSVEKAELHRFYNRYLRNELLRSDLVAGRLGVGYMANVAPMFFRLDRLSLRLLGAWAKLKRPLELFAGLRR